jgi:heme a synthase
MLERLRAAFGRVRDGTVAPAQYARVAYVAMGAFTLIVMSGAAVRLTGSGLGCPRWPRCYGKVYPPLEAHALIEFSNRMVTIPVTIAAFVAFLLALRRRPYRRDLVRLSALLPIGVLAQAVLGGLTVRGQLAYGWVMGHFSLSMLVLAAAVALAWRATHEQGASGASEQPIDGTASDVQPLAGRPGAATVGPLVVGVPEGASANGIRAAASAANGEGRLEIPAGVGLMAWVARGCVALAALTIFAGTAATAAGPHAGGSPGQSISRLRFDGRGTMDFVIHRHGEIAFAFGLLALCAWLLARRRGDLRLRRSTTVLCGLIALQGLVGLDQYETHLPTELVWVHVTLAALTWVAVLWMALSALRLSPQASSISLRKPSEGSTLAPAARTRSASQLSDVTTLTEPG